MGIPERIMWSYIVQLGSTIKAIHNSGMAIRGGLEVNRVLVTGKNRVRIGGAGVLDVLLWEGAGVAGYQVRSFGTLARGWGWSGVKWRVPSRVKLS